MKDRIDIKNICLDIEGKRILSRVNFTLDKGNICVLLGPNGAGKTTLFKCIKGFYDIGDGQIIYKGKESSSIPEAVMMFDEPVLYDELTGKEHIKLMSDINKIAYDKEWIAYLTGMMELKGAMKQLVGTYSLGMRKKLQLICSLAAKPELILMDEYISGLDPAILYSVKKVLKDYVSEGRYVIISTHMLDMAEKFCDKVILMKEGHVVDDRSFAIDEVCATYGDLEGFYMNRVGRI
ncbi:MAG: ABC transporter ATP-binding protein [Lachnospiraceae bacterium]|nr:ABC transporter ATP-binding protein [Lachnospiraceae bacterium]